MAAAYYYVKTDPNSLVPRFNDVNGMIVVAESSADALAIAKSKVDGDGNAVWGAATATVIAATADLEGWTLQIQVWSPAGAAVVDVTVTGAASATIDAIAALAVTALNATTPIAGSAYNSTSQVLKIAETTDNLGDHRTEIFFKPPAASYVDPQHVAGFIASSVDEGSAGAALTVTFAADARTVPTVVAQVKQVA